MIRWIAWVWLAFPACGMGIAEGADAQRKHVFLQDYAAHRKGEDWTPAILKAFADAPVVKVADGRYPCSHLKLPSGRVLEGAGEGTVFVPLGTRLFDISGKEGKEIKVAEDIVDFSAAMVLEDPTSLAPGDDIIIRGQRNSILREGVPGINYNPDWVLGRTRRSSCFFGEMDVVAAVDGSRITTKNNRLFPNYFKDDSREPAPPTKGFVQRRSTTVGKLQTARDIVLRKFSIEGTARCSMPVRLSFCKNCLIEDITFTTSVESYEEDGDPELSLVYGIYAWNTKVRNFRAILSPALLKILDEKEKTYRNFSGYNLFKMISSTASGFENCAANGGTHAFNITRSGSLASGGGIPSVNCYIRGCVASNCIWAGIKVQQGCHQTEVTGNTVTASAQGIITCGRRTLVAANNVSTRVPHSADYYYTHITRGGTFGIAVIEGYSCDSIVRDNIIDGFYSGLAVVDGYEKKNIFEEGNILFQGNKVAGCVRGFSLYKNPQGEALGRKDLKIRIENNTFIVSPDAISAKRETSGIWLPPQTAGVELASNDFIGFGNGVWLDGIVDLIHVHENTFTRCGTGIALAPVPAESAKQARIRESANRFEQTGTAIRGFTPSGSPDR